MVYEKINDETVDLLNNYITNLRESNEQLLGQLDSARARVVNIQKTLKEFEFENNRLKDILEKSTEITGEAERENKAITESINRALSIVRKLKTDYQGQ